MGRREDETYAQYVKRINGPMYVGQADENLEWRRKLEHIRDINRSKEPQGAFEAGMLHFDYCRNDGATNTDLGRYVLTDCGRGAQIARRGYRSIQDRFSPEQKAYLINKYRQRIARNIPESLPVFDQVILTDGDREQALKNLQELILNGELKCTKGTVSKKTRMRRMVSASRGRSIGIT